MLETVWNGQKGVYISSGLRMMESYTTHPPELEAFERNLFPSPDLVLDCIQTYGPLTKREIAILLGGEYRHISQVVETLVKQKKAIWSREGAIVGECGRTVKRVEAAI